MEKNDSRLSVEERYGTLEGYMCVVQRAVDQAVKERLLLSDDATRLVTQARESVVLPHDAESTDGNRAVARRVCGSGR